MNEPEIETNDLEQIIIPPPITSAQGPEDAQESIEQAKIRMPLEDDEPEDDDSQD